ncbi:hypothetical protein G6L28_08185 [Agrobacterium larrymoorei]|uniref:hypothetical protein n=1 Tax=Agrobacterium larrymoorei TaxID=160699 RepID=UPI00157243D0|nr:hypothetical protein [Agrobacterium larrymoorei]NTJ42575.1 hypothetical protein [Agrobacterium larrymoorei]
MPAYPTQEYKDYRELLDDMDVAIIAVKSFGSMVEHSIRTGEDLSADGYGMERLLNLQCRHLESIATALRDEFAEFTASKLAIRDTDQIAEWAGVSKYVVNRVISIATGIDLGPPTERHTDKPPYMIKKETANASA